MFLKCTLIACCLAFSAGLSAQAVANAVLEKSTVETGDTFTLRVLLNNSRVEPLKVDFSAWAPMLTSENILSESPWSRAGTRWQRQYTLLAFDSARLVLPPLSVQLRSGEKLMTNPVELLVTPTPAGNEVSDAETIRDIVREPTRWTDYWPWAAAALAVVILAMWFFRKKPKPVQQVAPVMIQAPAHETTLQQLAVLEQQQPWKHGKTEQFYAELSMIVRGYLERRFNVPALESTTKEILPLLKKTDFPDAQAAVLRDVLNQSDLAKFAQQTPPEQSHEKNLHNARKIVMASAQTPVLQKNIQTPDAHKPYSNL